MTPRAKKNQIRKRMQRINVSHRAYFIKNQTNIRLCHLEAGEYKYITIPFCDCKALTTAAQLLKECGIVDGYRMEELSGSNFYVALIRHKYERHTDITGVPVITRIAKVVEWGDLSLTRTDVKQFIARFELREAAKQTVIPMFPYHPQKRAA